MPDYYKTLGVSRDADAKVIKQQYRKLARTHHPDRGGNAETFKRINEAYEVLGDAQKRAQYDVPIQRFSPTFGSTSECSFTTIEINGSTKVVTTLETKNGVTTRYVTRSSIFHF